MAPLLERADGARWRYSIDEVRSRSARSLELTDARQARELADIDGVVSSLIEVLKLGRPLDVDGTIEILRRHEKEDRAALLAFDREASSSIRQMARTRPEALRLLNETKDRVLASIERAAKYRRDQRWRLIEARALHQPSEGVGPVRGEPSDPDDQLKNST